MQKLGEHDGLPDARASDKPDLSSFEKRTEKINYFNAGLENFLLCRHIAVVGRRPVYRKCVRPCDHSLAVQRRSGKVNNAPQKLAARPDRNRNAGIRNRSTPSKLYGGRQNKTVVDRGSRVRKFYFGDLTFDCEHYSFLFKFRHDEALWLKPHPDTSERIELFAIKDTVLETRTF